MKDGQTISNVNKANYQANGVENQMQFDFLSGAIQYRFVDVSIFYLHGSCRSNAKSMSEIGIINWSCIPNQKDWVYPKDLKGLDVIIDAKKLFFFYTDSSRRRLYIVFALASQILNISLSVLSIFFCLCLFVCVFALFWTRD